MRGRVLVSDFCSRQIDSKSTDLARPLNRMQFGRKESILRVARDTTRAPGHAQISGMATIRSGGLLPCCVPTMSTLSCVHGLWSDSHPAAR